METRATGLIHKFFVFLFFYLSFIIVLFFQSPDHRDKSHLASHGQNQATASGKTTKRRENKRKK